MRATSPATVPIPPPEEGAGSTRPDSLPRPRAILPAILAAILLAVGGAAQAQDRCDDTTRPGLAYSLDLDARRDASGTDVRVRFELLRADRPREVAGLLFADGLQVLGPDTVRPVACGEAVTWTTRLDRPEGTPLDLHATVDTAPRIPDAVARAGPDEPPVGAGFDLTYHPNDVAGRGYGAPREPPAGLTSRTAKRRPAPVAEAYLYDHDPAVPRHVRVLPPGETRWSFGVWFGETARRDGAFAVTCLVDDRQVAAFDGRPLWYGTLASGEAALVPARTPPLTPGWHEVRCLALDDLFAGEERGVAWPYVIRSTFVYRRP